MVKDRTINSDIVDLGRAAYRSAMGLDHVERDKDGFRVIRPTASRVDKRVETLTTDISDLEDRLKKFRAEKAAAVKYQKTDEYKESKKKEKKKKGKKAKNELLAMVFAAADKDLEESEEEEGYKDNKKRSKKERREKETTLDTQWGKRYGTIVSMLYDSINDFDAIAAEIDEELKSPKGQIRNMYRSNQIGNLLTAKEKKLQAIKEITSISNKLTDLETKANKNEAGVDSTAKAISNYAAKFLKGSFDYDGSASSKKSSKKDKKKVSKRDGESQFAKEARKMGTRKKLEDISDDERKKRKAAADDDLDLARALADELSSRKGISFSPLERSIEIDGKYKVVVVCDPLDPEGDWKFAAVDIDSGEFIKNFDKDYPGVLPKKSKARPVFEISKGRLLDRASGKRYQLLYK